MRRAMGEAGIQPDSAAGAAGTVGGGAGAAFASTFGGAAGADGAGAAPAGALASAFGAAAGAAPARSDEMSSSGSATMAISLPTGTMSPSATRIFRRTPEPKASSSISALSVSMDARTSPPWTRSPSFFSH